MTVNVELLRKVLEHITAHPEEWRQEEWATATKCGTAFCLAGHVALTVGHEINFDGGQTIWDQPGVRSTDSVAGGRRIADVAADALGIDAFAAAKGRGGLFYPHNTLADLWRIAGELTDGEIVAPPDLAGA